jgi:hypothetical protein
MTTRCPGDARPGADERRFGTDCLLSWCDQDLIHRLPAPFVRHLLAHHRTGQLSARAAAAELGLGRARFYELHSDYLRACAHGQADTWSPGHSGGDHHARFQLKLAISDVLDEGLPRVYSTELCQQKCAAVFTHFYESNPEAGNSTCAMGA